MLGQQAFVVGGFQGFVERGFICARVVFGAVRGGVGEGFFGDEVLAAHLYGAQPAFGGEEIYGSLHGCGGFGTACPAIRQHRGGVGDDRFGCGFYLGYLVDACGHDVGEERQERPEPAICA